jgi:hypothetical protein
MADLSAGDNVILWINDSTTEPAGKAFTIQKHSAPVTMFKVNEDGTVELHGILRRSSSHVFDNATSGNGDMVTFVKDGTSHLSFAWNATDNEVQIRSEKGAGTDSPLRLVATADVVFVIDHDDGGSSKSFTLQDPDKNEALRVQTDGSFELRRYNRARHRVTYSGGDALVEVGVNDEGRGRLSCHRLGGGQPKAGALVLCDSEGGEHWICMSTDGKLRIHTTDFDVNDAVGSPVGTQS